MSVVERFLRYVTMDTQSDPSSNTVPSTGKQMELGALLVNELHQLGLSSATMTDKGYVYAWLPATPGHEGVPCLGLIAHMDTSPDASGAEVTPRIHPYTGGDIDLGGAIMKAVDFPSLAHEIGKDLIVTDGTTLLGADDKAGIAEIMSAIEYLTQHPDIPHGKIAIGFTPDEEIGAGADHFDVAGFGAAAAYTVDGGELGELEYENFNGASTKVTIHGFNIHPGSAKGKMRNAALLAAEFIASLPSDQTPGTTEGYEGFYHLHDMCANETLATLSYIIRDHDKALFEQKKQFIQQVADVMNAKYGSGVVDVSVCDSYYNMKEQIEPHMYLIHRARSAFRKVGVEAIEVPIRGGTDGARLSYMGLPCPNLSTGGVNFHGVMEYIPVQSLETMVSMLIQLVTIEQ